MRFYKNKRNMFFTKCYSLFLYRYLMSSSPEKPVNKLRPLVERKVSFAELFQSTDISSVGVRTRSSRRLAASSVSQTFSTVRHIVSSNSIPIIISSESDSDSSVHDRLTPIDPNPFPDIDLSFDDYDDASILSDIDLVELPSNENFIDGDEGYENDVWPAYHPELFIDPASVTDSNPPPLPLPPIAPPQHPATPTALPPGPLGPVHPLYPPLLASGEEDLVQNLLLEFDASNASAKGPSTTSHGRKQKVSMRMSERGTAKAVSKALGDICCPGKCISDFTPRQVLTARQKYLNMSHQIASNWLFAIMLSSYSTDDCSWNFLVLGASVCLNAFCLFHGITQSKWYKTRKDFFSGRTNVTHGRTGAPDLPAPKSLLVRHWMNEFILSVGDTPTNSEVHLPMAMRKVDIYHRMIQELRESHPKLTYDDLPSIMLFRTTWKKHFPHVKNPKKTRLGKCNLCSRLNKRRAVEKNPVIQAKISQLYFKHVKDIIKERALYILRQSRAIKLPQLYTSIIMDYAQKLLMPHNHRYPKRWLRHRNRPFLQIGGLINHGFNPNLYVHFDWFPSDPNLTLTTLFSHLVFQRRRGKLGSTLYLQMDNCARENKNRHHLAFCHVLVEKRWFKDIFVTFLPTGHTHEDIDRMFRRYHDLRKCEDCDTASDFIALWVTEAYRTCIPKVKYVTRRYDWKAWLDPHLHDMGQHSFFRAFHFFRDANCNDLVVFKVKRSPLDDTWIGREANTNVGFEMMRSTPRGFPRLLSFVPMPPEKYEHVPVLFQDLSPSTIAWWRHFFRDQTFWCPAPDPTFRASIWNIVPPVVEDPLDGDAIPEVPHPVQRRLNMPHQRVLSLDELEIGSLCAVSPDEGFYAADDVDAPQFWIGKIIRKIPETNEILLHYYHRSERNSEIFHVCDDDVTGTTGVLSILAHNFKLTSVKHVFQSTLREIAAALEHDV